MDIRAGVLMQRNATCAGCGVRGVFSDIGDGESAALHACSARVTTEKGEPMFHAGARASAVYCIRSGSVKMVRYARDGGQRIVAIVRPGGLAGMEALLSSTFDHSAVAMERVAACRIPLPQLRGIVDSSPILQRRLLDHVYGRLRESEMWLAELLGSDSDVRKRLARLLLRCRQDGSDMVPCFSLEDVGAVLGIANETVCRNLAHLRRAGLLRECRSKAAGRYYKADIAGLERMAGHPGHGRPARP
ncbi:MAG TPA: Crp/Fnr family transcriptional regulator [Rhodocyclaceae bacterium]